MSRVIKFRAWDSARNVMHSNVDVSGGCAYAWKDVPKDAIDATINTPSGTYHLYSGWAIQQKRPELVLMQFTGLTDSNGVEIYEGDILRIPAKNDYEKHTFNCFEVFYHDNDCIGGQNIGFCMNRMHTQGNSAGGHGYRFTPGSIRSHGFVVIGNIYQHKHLLDRSSESP